MSWFEFNGVNSESLDIITTKTPYRPSWREKSISTEVVGRMQNVTEPSGIYDNQDLIIQCGFTTPEKLLSIYQLYQGIGILKLSTSKGEYLIAEAYDVNILESYPNLIIAAIAFNCFPFAYLENDKSYTFNQSDIRESSYKYISKKFRTGGTAPCEPTYTLRFTGIHADLRIRIDAGDSSLVFTVSEDYVNEEIIVDSGLQHIYIETSDGKKSLNDCINSFSGTSFLSIKAERFGESEYNGNVFVRAWLDEMHDGSFKADGMHFFDSLEIKCNARNL